MKKDNIQIKLLSPFRVTKRTWKHFVRSHVSRQCGGIGVTDSRGWNEVW